MARCLWHETSTRHTSVCVWVRAINSWVGIESATHNLIELSVEICAVWVDTADVAYCLLIAAVANRLDLLVASRWTSPNQFFNVAVLNLSQYKIPCWIIWRQRLKISEVPYLICG